MKQGRRKPLPYAAGIRIDNALMENSNAVRDLMVVISGGLSSEEVLRRVASAVHHVHESTIALQDVPRLAEEEK